MDGSLLKFNFDPWVDYFQIVSDASSSSVSDEVPSPEKTTLSSASSTATTHIPSSAPSPEPNSSTKSFRAKCKLCSGIVKVAFSSTCNLKSHLKRKHNDISAEIIRKVYAIESQLKRKRKNQATRHDEKRFKPCVTQTDLDTMIVSAMCNNALSFNVLNEPSMRFLLQSGFPSLRIMSRKAIVPRLHDQFQNMMAHQKEIFRKLHFVCLTADSWSSYRRWVNDWYDNLCYFVSPTRNHYELSISEIILASRLIGSTQKTFKEHHVLSLVKEFEDVKREE